MSFGMSSSTNNEEGARKDTEDTKDKNKLHLTMQTLCVRVQAHVIAKKTFLKRY